jgi:hypothetical protein
VVELVACPEFPAEHVEVLPVANSLEREGGRTEGGLTFCHDEAGRGMREAGGGEGPRVVRNEVLAMLAEGGLAIHTERKGRTATTKESRTREGRREWGDREGGERGARERVDRRQNQGSRDRH